MHACRNKASFYGEELLAPCPTSELEDQPMSAVRDCLVNILAATLTTGGPSSIHPKDASCCGKRGPCIVGPFRLEGPMYRGSIPVRGAQVSRVPSG
jgi:hypothetical protein